MKLNKKYLFLVFLICTFINHAFSQNSLSNGDLEIRFLKDQVEINEGKSFFNLLIIKNKTDRELNFNVQYNTPKDWELIGSKFENVTIQPFGEITLPVRVSVSKNVKGGVGYAVVASINDLEGSVYNTEYAFVKIPVRTSLIIKTDKTSGFFNHKELKTDFTLKVENSGNIDEIVNVQMVPDRSLTVEKDRNDVLVDNITINSGSTQDNTYSVQLNQDINLDKYKLHKLQVNFNTADTAIQKILWFKYLDWQFKNETPEIKNPLNIEASAFNIFGDGTPIYTGRIYGHILLKKRRDLFYSFENYNRDNNSNLWINSRIVAQYTTPKTTIFLGDYTGNFERSLYGRGIFVSQKISSKSIIQGAFTKKLTSNTDNYALSVNHAFKKSVFVDLGGVYSKTNTNNDDIQLAYTKFSTNIYKSHISVLLGGSQSRFHQLIDIGPHLGWGYRFNFSSNVKKINLKINSEYGTPLYQGYSQGRLHTRGLARLNLNNTGNITMHYYMINYKPAYFENSEIFSDKYTNLQRIKILYGFSTSKNIYVFAGPIFRQEKTNTFSFYGAQDPFASYTGFIEAGTKMNFKFTDNSFSFMAKYGMTKVYDFSTIINGISYENRLGENLYNVAQINSSFTHKNLGVSLIYHLGPYNIAQQFAYFYSYVYSKSLSIIPYYEKELIEDKLNFIIRGSYINNLTSKNTRVNFNTGITWFAGKGWTFDMFNTSSLYRVKNSSGSATFTSTYFEFRLKKAFYFQQPRLKYYKYNAVFYKDLNGNRIHDANEPGVSDVFADINRADPERDQADVNYNGEYLDTELLSNQEGTIEYDNIVEGEYTIKYTPQGQDLGAFESESVEQSFTVNSDTIMFIPFLERNKLYGQINLYRTKHSALGEIPLDNIKITVEGNNKTYSALSEREGYFEMYIPVADYYKVRINNIFSEHFDIRQEYYIVKFNGYKQFEISFDFDEKERTIAFDESDFLVDDDDVPDDDFSFDDIKVIKQTNLKGTIKDANSLLPLHSTVSIFNSNTNQMISETASSRRTGVFFTSFFAGESYYIKVSSKGYWVVKENLNIQQVTTFENITKDVLLNKINIDDEIRMDNLNFNSESAELSPLAKAELDDMLSTLFLNPSIIVEISGHTDNIEALLTNAKQLSKARASNVASYLVKNGLKENRVKIIGKGNTDPKTQDDSEDGRARNRRVDIKVAGF